MENQEKMMTGEESLRIIIRFRPLIIGGICFWIMTLVVHFGGTTIGPLGVPVTMIAGYLVPGYMLKNKADHDKV
jgi:hypothetical protein